MNVNFALLFLQVLFCLILYSNGFLPLGMLPLVITSTTCALLVGMTAQKPWEKVGCPKARCTAAKPRIQNHLKSRSYMRFLMLFRVENAPYPTLHECFFREASRGLERKLIHIIWRHPAFQFLLTWRYVFRSVTRLKTRAGKAGAGFVRKIACSLLAGSFHSTVVYMMWYVWWITHIFMYQTFYLF